MKKRELVSKTMSSAEEHVVGSIMWWNRITLFVFFISTYFVSRTSPKTIQRAVFCCCAADDDDDEESRSDHGVQHVRIRTYHTYKYGVGVVVVV